VSPFVIQPNTDYTVGALVEYENGVYEIHAETTEGDKKYILKPSDCECVFFDSDLTQATGLLHYGSDANSIYAHEENYYIKKDQSDVEDNVPKEYIEVYVDIQKSQLTPLNYAPMESNGCKLRGCFETEAGKKTSIYEKSGGVKQPYKRSEASLHSMHKSVFAIKNQTHLYGHQQSDRSQNTKPGVDIKHNSYHRRLLKLKAKTHCKC
jgi:hypothetical protein